MKLSLLALAARGASAATLCEAHPEVCDGTFVGVNMNFPNEGLTGTLPTEIFQYSFITYLGLYGNSLSGTMSAESSDVLARSRCR